MSWRFISMIIRTYINKRFNIRSFKIFIIMINNTRLYLAGLVTLSNKIKIN
jgi:hypothetical protein